MSLSTPALLTTATVATGSATSLTSASVSPSSDALLIAIIKTTGDRSGSLALSSTTLANVGSWTTVTPTYSGNADAGTLMIAYAQITGSPGSGTVTASWTSGSNAVMFLVEVTGHNTSAPVTQSKIGSASTTGTTYSLTLDASPASTSAVIAGLAHRSITGITPGASFTELGDTTPSGSGNQRAQSQYDLTSATTTVDWSTLTDGNARLGMAIEVAEAAAVSTFTPQVVFF